MSKSVQEQRDDMRDMLTQTRAYQKTMFKKIDKIEEHLAHQNGRLRDVEKSQSLMKGIGITISLVLSAIITFVKGE